MSYDDSISGYLDITLLKGDTLTTVLEFFDADDTPYVFSDKAVFIYIYVGKTTELLESGVDYSITDNIITFSWTPKYASACDIGYKIVTLDNDDVSKTLLFGKIILK